MEEIQECVNTLKPFLDNKELFKRKINRYSQKKQYYFKCMYNNKMHGLSDRN